jgi:hypothetical protein
MKKLTAGACLLVLALAGASIAVGAVPGTKAYARTTSTAVRPGGPGNGETPLTGDTAAEAKAAAVAKVGGTADIATTETDNSNTAAVYEVHVTKADGSRVTVIEDTAFNVLGVETGGPGGPGPHGGWGH